MAEYIPKATADTIYYKPETQREMEEMVGDMIFSKWVFQASGGMWYTLGLCDKNTPDSTALFPNITLGEDENLPPLTRWGLERYRYLKEHCKFFANQLGTIGLHKHCLEIQEQSEERKRHMMAAIRKDPYQQSDRA